MVVPALRSLRFFLSLSVAVGYTAYPPSSAMVIAAEGVAERGTWQTMAPAPTKRTEVAAAAVNGKIYVVGGFAKPSVSNILSISNAVEVYDPQTNQWGTKAALPTRLHHAGAASVGGKLYVVGGFTRSFLAFWTPVATAYRYDPATDLWTELAPLPTPRGALAVAVSAGKVYAVGGIGEEGNSDAVEMYDPATNTWSIKAPLPTPRDHLAAVFVSGHLYAIGGRLNGSYSRNLAVTEVYDPVHDRWSTAAPLPTARSGIAAGVINDIIYVVGGEAPEGTFQTNEAYAPASNRWWPAAPMPTGRHGLGAVVVGRQLYVIAGGTSPGGSFSDINERYEPGMTRTSRLTAGRASPTHVGTIMALLAAFQDAGVLPPESSPDANRLIRALIQFQSALMKSENPSVRQLLADSFAAKNGRNVEGAIQRFRTDGWTSYSLEAVVDYAATNSVWDNPELVNGFHEYNIGSTEFELLARTFLDARGQFASSGEDFHAVYAKRRRQMRDSVM